MVLKLILVENIFDVDMISDNDFQNTETKIFSFNLETHQKLKSKKIPHEIADDLLKLDDRLELFDICFKFHSWYSELPSKNYEFENVNLLKLVDSTGFHLLLMQKLINFVLIKRIIEKEKPSKILASALFSTTINSINVKNYIKTIFLQKSFKQKFLWDTIPIEYNIGKINFSFNLSRKKYLKIKRLIESSVYFLFNLKFNFNDSKKKNIIFLEFNVDTFSKLFNELKNFNGNVILVNLRRPAIWNIKSLNVLRKSNCKVIQLENFLNKKEKKEVSLLSKDYSGSINKLWENSEFFSTLFQFEGVNFWNVIKEYLIHLYSNNLFYHMKLIASIKKFYDHVDPSCLISLNETGETEKSFIEFGKNKVPSILLQHGFSDKNDDIFVSKFKRHDSLGSYDNFNDKIAVWSEVKKKYLISTYGIDPKRIIVTGSPKHDIYFSSRKPRKNNKEKIILLAPNPISDLIGLSTTQLKLEFIEFITRLISIIKKFDNVKLIVKLHPFPMKHNKEIQLLINKIDKNIPIYLSTPIIDIVNLSDVVIVVSPEPGTTTMLLESMILGKPTMNIYFDEEVPKFNHVRHNAVFSFLNNCNLENNLHKILFDEIFQNELINNADDYILKHLNNIENSSKIFTDILKSY